MITTVDGVADAIKAKTDLIPSDPAETSDITSATAKIQNHVITRVWFSDRQISATISDAGGNKSLPSVVLPNIAGTIVAVQAGITFRAIENTDADANMLAGVQYIQVKENAAGSYTNAIKFADDDLYMPAESIGAGDTVVGAIDVSGQVAAFNKTYAFQFTSAVSDDENLILRDIQTFLVVTYV